VVPSWRSYLLVVLTVPIVSLAIGAFSSVMVVYQLPLYSLPFSLVVIGVVFLLNNRYESKGLQLVLLQQYSPEKNLYSFWNNMERFKSDTYYHIHLPFYGNWRVSQGHDGGITHKGDWRFAWDFDVTDEEGKTYRGDGKDVSDFYCYGLPVLAPAPGYVTTVVDDVSDNAIGDVNIEANWGNSIVIKHGDYLYSKISHIKRGSFKVKVGDYVAAGETLALCGNSGRSPEPHIHFQVQAAPHVGAKTMVYPISYFISKEKGKTFFHSFQIPTEGQTIARPQVNPVLQKAFNFIPGLKLRFVVAKGAINEAADWEVFVDAMNQPYIYCHSTKSTAYFVNNQTLFYFTAFYGDRQSLLHYFYLGSYKVLLGYYPSLNVADAIPIEGFYDGMIKYVHDFAAPFHRYLHARYESNYLDVDDLSNPSRLTMQSSAMALLGKRPLRRIDFTFTIEENLITGFKLIENDICTEAKRLL
jgi:murein DD-endopeptidase MepM/ murein hydrolase activator NlpD